MKTDISPDRTIQHAIVIGGSLAGLLTARVLSQYFKQVTLIERDALADRPECRSGQPQARHLHGLLASGKAVLERYFPDLIDSLAAEGAVVADMGQAARWHVVGDYRIQYESGMTGILMSRPFLEWQIRRRVLALPNVKRWDNTKVEALITTADRSQITGVRVRRRASQTEALEIFADLVIDASGRNSVSPGWLADLGYPQPIETVVTMNMGYATQIYRRQPQDLTDAAYVMISPAPPHNPRAGLAFPIEADRWIVTLAGWGENQPPLDKSGFLHFARSLPASDVYELIQRAEPLSEISGYKFPSSRRRHYEKLNRFPSGYLVIGDALCSFDPAYGQGMTVAALQAAQLDTLLQQLNRSSVSSAQLWKRFFQQAAKIIDIPWQLTVSEDFRFPATQGHKPLGTEFINAYGTLVQRATHSDPIVYAAFLKVMNLMSPPSSLFQPQIVWHVLQTLGKAKTRRDQNPALEQA